LEGWENDFRVIEIDSFRSQTRSKFYRMLCELLNSAALAAWNFTFRVREFYPGNCPEGTFRVLQTRHTVDQSVAKLREADVERCKGKKVLEICKLLEVTEQTCCRWRQKYGGMKPEMAKQLKALEKENARLKKMVAEQALDMEILKEAAEQEHMEDELERWRKATIDNPTSSEAFFHFGRMLYELDRWEDSVPIFEKSVELNPENCEALAMLGLAHGNLRAFSKSVLALERAYQLDSSHPGRVCAYGESLVLSGDTERADQIYSELRILDEQYAGQLRSFIEADRSNA